MPLALRGYPPATFALHFHTPGSDLIYLFVSGLTVKISHSLAYLSSSSATLFSSTCPIAFRIFISYSLPVFVFRFYPDSAYVYMSFNQRSSSLVGMTNQQRGKKIFFEFWNIAY